LAEHGIKKMRLTIEEMGDDFGRFNTCRRFLLLLGTISVERRGCLEAF